MSQPTDHELLTDFARSQSEDAFAELVTRYVNLVYSVALRSVGNAHQAEEITQAVFIILTRKAAALPSSVVLSGWLYQTTRFTAANFIKAETRRQRREQEAYMQSTLNNPGSETWQQIAPLLEEAMGRLGEIDRNAVVLRFFENKTAAEAAAILKLTEAATHKRTNRALDKLRKIFSKHGVTSTTAIIAGAISAHSIHMAPAAVSHSVMAVATAKGAAASASTLTLIQGALKLMASTKLKIGIASAIIVALVATTATMTAVHFSKSDRSVEFSIVNHSDLGLSNFSINSDHFALLLGAIPPGTSMRGTYHADSRGWFYFEANGLKLDSRGKDFRNYFTFAPREPMSFEIGPDLQVTARH